MININIEAVPDLPGPDPAKHLFLRQNRSKKLYFHPLKPTFQGSKQHCKHFVIHGLHNPQGDLRPG